MVKKMKLKHLIADSGAFICNANLVELAENVYTCHEVVTEVKDKATRQRLSVLPYELILKEPSPTSISKIVEVSKISGDYSSLSHTDIKVLALTYELTRQHEPEVGIVESIQTKSETQFGKKNVRESDLLGFYMPRDAEENSNKADDDPEILKSGFEKDALEFSEGFCVAEGKLPKFDETSTLTADERVCHADELCERLEDVGLDIDCSDNTGNWITPDLLKEINSHEKNTEKQLSTKVACLTTDFAMQNVLLKMKMRVVSVDGLLIKTARSYVLRCHACFNVTKQMEKLFCPKCGNKTLKRVPVEIQEDGTMKMFFSKNPKVLNPRGLRYSLPKPQGGKHSRNPWLCEDQPMPHDRPSRKSLQRTDVWSDDYECGASPFAPNEINSRAFRLGVRNGQRSGKRNPNAVGRKFVKRK